MGARVAKNYWQPDDRIHALLRASIKRVKRHLWVPSDAVTFKPALCGTVYGDGRALYAVTTCNDRPRFWIVRGCSTWGVFYDREEGETSFHEVADQVLGDLEYEFDLKWNDPDGYERKKPRPYPAICSESGLSWGRYDWPKLDGVKLVPHPRDPQTDILHARYTKRNSSNSKIGASALKRQSGRYPSPPTPAVLAGANSPHLAPGMGGQHG